MSTNKTANYHLCQWVGTDDFRRDDFNADNLKIDYAIKSVADGMAYTKIAAVKQAVQGLSMSLDLSGVDLNQYMALELLLHVEVNSAAMYYHNLRANNVSTNIYYRSVNGAAATQQAYIMRPLTSDLGHSKTWRILFSQPAGAGDVHCEYMEYSGNATRTLTNVQFSGIKWNQLTSIDYVSNDAPSQILPESSMTLIGVKRP